jgi:hypothetical protein
MARIPRAAIDDVIEIFLTRVPAGGMKKKISTAGARKNASEDRFLVILEDMRDQFSAFGDGLSFFSERLGVLIDKVDAMDRCLMRIERLVLAR